VWQRVEAIRAAVDQPLLERLLADLPLASGKVLMVGAAWPTLAVKLAEAGLFVTCVDSNADAARRVSEAAASARVLAQVTVQDTDYKDINFAASAFHLAVVWDSLDCYSEIRPVLKKLHRELKTGGRLFVRARVHAQKWDETLAPNFRRLVRSLLALTPERLRTISPDVVADETFLAPWAFGLERDELLSAIEDQLVVREGTPHHRLVADLADIPAHLLPPLRGLMPALAQLDQRLVAKHPEIARFLAVDAVKEKQLGKPFTVR